MKIIALLVLIFSFQNSFANNWVSPIDNKYKSKSPSLFENFVKSRNNLDEYSGNRKDLIETKSLLDSILSIDSGFAPAYLEYGRLYMKAGHIVSGNFQAGALGSAESAILESIKLEPEYADAYVLLGYLYTQIKSYDKAEESLKKAQSIGTENPWFHLNYADLIKKQGKHNESLPHYIAVINSNTSNSNAYNYALLGAALHYRYIKDYDESEIWYKKLVEHKQSAWNFGEYSSFQLFWLGDIDGAIENGEKAISIMNYGLGRLNLACAYYAKWASLIDIGKAEEANVYYSKAIALIPDTGQAVIKMSHYMPTKSIAKKLANYHNSQIN